MTCPTPTTCLQETCCPPQEFEYLADQVVMWTIGDFGDPAGNPASVAAIINADSEADIVLAIGDCSYNGNYSADVGAFYGTPWLSRAKFWPLPGNHDWTYGALLSTYLAYFSFLGGRYYSKRFGIVEVFFVDDGFDTAMAVQEPDGNAVGSVQYQFFQKAIAASKAVWKIVCMHHPPFSSGSGHTGQPGVTPPGNTPVLQWDFKALGVDLVVAAHEHSAEFLLIGGVPYVVNGTGGKDLTGFGTPVSGSLFRYNTAFGGTRLRITPDSILVEFRTVLGTTPYSYLIEK